MNKAYRFAIGIGLILTLTGARYVVLPLTNQILPPEGLVEPGTVRVVHPGDVILRNPLASSPQATLLDDVTVTTPGLTETFRSGDPITPVQIVTNYSSLKPVAGLPTDTSYYCHTPTKVTSGMLREASGIYLPGICFYDRDHDGIPNAFDNWDNRRR